MCINIAQSMYLPVASDSTVGSGGWWMQEHAAPPQALPANTHVQYTHPSHAICSMRHASVSIHSFIYNYNEGMVSTSMHGNYH